MAELTFSERYPSLSEMGLFPELLLAVAGDSDSCSDIENIPRSKVTNRTMLELTIQFFVNGNSSCTYTTLHWRRVSSLFGSCRSIKSLRQSVVCLSAKLTKLKKIPSCDEKSSKIADFLNQNNELPNVFVACGKVIVSQ